MNRTRKAVLLSALAIPGAGHWYLGKKWQSVVLMLAALAAFFVLMSGALTQANLIADKILSGEVQPELSALMNLLAEQRNAEKSSSMAIATVVAVVVWLIGVVDAWRVGKAETTKQNTARRY